MYYTNGFKDEKGEQFILEVFNLLNGVVNPNNLVDGVHFYNKLDNVSLGFIVLTNSVVNRSFDTNYIVVGSSNIRDFIASYGRERAYMYFIDFVAHELYHTTQNIDLPRYVADEEYNDMIETDCEFHTALFMYNYSSWLQSHLSQPFDIIFGISNNFRNLLKAEHEQIHTNMINDPWVINM